MVKDGEEHGLRAARIRGAAVVRIPVDLHASVTDWARDSLDGDILGDSTPGTNGGDVAVGSVVKMDVDTDSVLTHGAIVSDFVSKEDGGSRRSRNEEANATVVAAHTITRGSLCLSDLVDGTGCVPVAVGLWKLESSVEVLSQSSGVFLLPEWQGIQDSQRSSVLAEVTCVSIWLVTYGFGNQRVGIASRIRRSRELLGKKEKKKKNRNRY